jgi:DMSO/TMAO reductase YedYZ heme-binding membrane subunit
MTNIRPKHVVVMISASVLVVVVGLKLLEVKSAAIGIIGLIAMIALLISSFKSVFFQTENDFE